MSERAKLNPLTSLRFIAAAFIAIGHSGQQVGFEAFRFDLFNAGNAVSFFYVLSGFILSYTYFNMDEKRDYRRYLVARVGRVWPLHVVTLAFIAYEFGPLPLMSNGLDAIAKFSANAFLLHSWVPYADWFYSYNWVSWSISTELAFYVSFPALLFFMKKDWKIVASLAVVLLSTMLGVCIALDFPAKPSVDTISSSALLYISPLCRIVEFMAGMLTWKVYSSMRERSSSPLSATALEVGSLAILVLSMTVTHQLWKYDRDLLSGGVMGWLATAGSFPFIAFAIFVMAKQQGLVSKFLSNKALVYLGEISFSVYMVHQIILRLFGKYYSDLMVSDPVSMYSAFWIATIAVSAILYHVVETPCRKVIRAKLAGAPPVASMA
ncbi:acyltransferase family protein [Pseudomonas kribbensis]|uniref:acyltransferase family protein n=1 Tax=Pseudomonas kribbensis TaxID=1628086 RepID=UPI001F20D6DB|nr:acyltransferase [Pseudomonas kribbensis]UIN53631.1 acyltransferase [Pseudomonas kribbensis]